MATFKYVGIYDSADIIGVGTVKNGDTFDVPDSDAPKFSEQPSNFAPVDPAPAKAPAPAPASTTTSEA